VRTVLEMLSATVASVKSQAPDVAPAGLKVPRNSPTDCRKCEFCMPKQKMAMIDQRAVARRGLVVHLRN